MKIELLKEQKKTTFKPIELVITVESALEYTTLTKLGAYNVAIPKLFDDIDRQKIVKQLLRSLFNLPSIIDINSSRE